MDRIVCIAGPTASGKTALAVELARELDGEVISCDSMQASPLRRRCRVFPTICSPWRSRRKPSP